MSEWQLQWDSNERGKWTRSLIPSIQEWYESNFGGLSFWTTQVLTGHGKFQEYLYRMKIAPSPTCVYCSSGNDDDVDHTILRCSAFIKERAEITDSNSIAELVRKLLKSREDWDRITKAFERILKRKTEVEKERANRFTTTQPL